MPLKCLHGEEEICSLEMESKEAWEGLRKENTNTKILRMPCCGAAVILKTSPLGTRYFAHVRKGPCKTAPETAEHLLAKKTIIEGLSRTDWIVKPEQDGIGPNGEKWKADVLASKGALKVAFEVQWSRQSDDETRRRQARYDAAKVRGLWLFRQNDFPFGKDVPAFHIMLNEESKTFSVVIPSNTYHFARYMATHDKHWMRHWQVIELSRFAAGAVSGKLKFAPALGLTVPLEISVTPSTCWRCKVKTRLVTNMVFKVSSLLAGHPDIHTSKWAFDKSIPNGPALIAKWLPRSLLAKHGIGALKVRKSILAVERGESYLSNGCVKCDALQARHFQGQYLSDRPDRDAEELALTVNVVFDESWAGHLNNINRWWFDDLF